MFNNKTISILAIFSLIFAGMCFAQTQTQEEKDQVVALRVKADQEAASAPKAKKAKPPKKAKSALDLSCESFNDAHDKAVCYTAQSNEFKKRAETAKKTALASEPDSMKKVREKDKKAEKRDKNAVKFQATMQRRANIQGCPADTVNVHYKAEMDWDGSVGTAITVVNPNPYPVNISRPRYGDIVENLCAGGRMTLHMYVQWNEGNSVNFPLTATAVTPDGVMMVGSTSVYMSRYTAPESYMTESSWVINLNRQQQNR